MIRIARRNLEKLPALLAVIFLLVQVAADLYLPTITSPKEGPTYWNYLMSNGGKMPLYKRP